MTKIRLLELRNTYKWGGGPDKTILLSAERHDRTKVDPVITYIRDATDTEFRIADKARAKGLIFYEIEERGKFDVRVLYKLREIIIRHDINLIHSHDYKSDLFAYLLRWWLRPRHVALVSTAHAWVMLGLRGEIYRRLDLWLMRHFDHLIAVSRATKGEMMTAGMPQDLITVIHNAIDTEVWALGRVPATLREELALGRSVPVIGYTGRIMPEKDLETWLRAAALVARRYPKAQFVLVGEGKDGVTHQQLEQLATSLGIAHLVHFTGYREDLLAVYGTFDIFMLSSRREGLPNSILEAMAVGLPVVTTDVAGVKELVLDQETGFVLPQGDVNGLARAVTGLIENQVLRRRMGLASREQVKQKFSFITRLRHIEALYEHIIRLSLCRVPASEALRVTN